MSIDFAQVKNVLEKCMNQTAQPQFEPALGAKTMDTKTIDTKTIDAKSSSKQLVTGALLFSLGFALLYFSGFSSLHAVHNAAHDARHSAAFPCH